jgi:hypothetical protein
METKSISKKKFAEAKIQKVMEELDKVEYSGLAFNQILKAIRCYIANKLYCVFANTIVQKSLLNLIDRRIVDNFIKGQKLQVNMMYMSGKDGGLGIPCMKDEYNAYKVHHVERLMCYVEGRQILKGYLKLKRLSKFQDQKCLLNKALSDLSIRCVD